MPPPITSSEVAPTSALRAGRRAVGALFLINGFLIGVWASRIPAVMVQYDLSPGSLGALLLVLATGAVMALPFSGYLIDRVGSGNVTGNTTAVYIISIVLIPLEPDTIVLAAALWLFGVVHGAMDVAMNGWAAKLETAYRRPIMSSFHALFSLGTGLGAASIFFAVPWGVGMVPHITGAALIAGIGLVWTCRQPDGCDLTPQPEQKAPPFRSAAGTAIGGRTDCIFCASIGEGRQRWLGQFVSDGGDSC